MNTRSWLKRGYLGQTPRWGESVPELWRNTSVTFKRRREVRNDYGFIDGGMEETLWETTAHLDIVQNRAGSETTVLPTGQVSSFSWLIITPYPSSAAQIPEPGDWVEFKDVSGHKQRLQLKHVFSPEGVSDHLEMDTQEFE